MIDLIYDTATKKPKAWNGDMKQETRAPRPGESLIRLDIPVPPLSITKYNFDEGKNELAAKSE